MQRLTIDSYTDTHRDFSWDIPDTFNFGGDVVDQWAEDHQRKALIWLNEAGDEKHYTFADI